MEYRRIEVPIRDDVLDEFVGLCERTFDPFDDGLRSILCGVERSENRDVVYLAIDDGRVVASSHLTVSNRLPIIGGLGEVATEPEFRGRGLAGELCQRALDDFKSHGGQALFLGTVNPAAARIYHRLGWRRLPNTNVMACITNGNSPEEFLVDYFRAAKPPLTFHELTPEDRVPLIPLVVTPHDWQVLDMNANLFSTRHVTLNSCMGLYARFSQFLQDERGGAWVARSADGRVVGCTTVRGSSAGQAEFISEQHGHIDGFMHHRFKSNWPDLMQSALRSCEANNLTSLTAIVSIEEEEKRKRFESLEFRESRRGTDIDVSNRMVPSIHLTRERDSLR